MNWKNEAYKALQSRSPENAICELLRQAKTNQGLQEELLKLGAGQAIRSVLTEGRRPSAAVPEAPNARQPNEARASEPIWPSRAGAEAKKRFMDVYRLFGGEMLLSQATAVDLAVSARKHDAQAKGHNAAAAFEREVGKIVQKSGKRVGDVCDDAKLKEMAKKRKV
jgi:hypothetical protein